MKIALCGSAPASSRKAPFGDPDWKIWGCSPALYPIVARVDAWFELHRWEPPVIGKADQQVPWFTPEYCSWMASRKCVVWMREKVLEIPTSQVLPWEVLVKKYGHFFFTSSLAWMAAVAIETILQNRAAGNKEDDMIGFWGVDMAADDEIYSGQRSGCQFFATLASSLDIKVYTPPESDLMLPMALYGISEGSHRSIRLMARKNELIARKNAAEQQAAMATRELHYLNGALDDMKYHMSMWLHEGEILGTRFEDIFDKPVLLDKPEPVVEKKKRVRIPKANGDATGAEHQPPA